MCWTNKKNVAHCNESFVVIMRKWKGQLIIMHFLCGFILFDCRLFTHILPRFSFCRLSGLENGLLGLSSRNNAVTWSRSVTEIENVDIICFGHLLYEMCTGQELTTPKPSVRVLEMELQHYPQIGQVGKE